MYTRNAYSRTIGTGAKRGSWPATSIETPPKYFPEEHCAHHTRAASAPHPSSRPVYVAHVVFPPPPRLLSFSSLRPPLPPLPSIPLSSLQFILPERVDGGDAGHNDRHHGHDHSRRSPALPGLLVGGVVQDDLAVDGGRDELPLVLRPGLLVCKMRRFKKKRKASNQKGKRGPLSNRGEMPVSAVLRCRRSPRLR